MQGRIVVLASLLLGACKASDGGSIDAGTDGMGGFPSLPTAAISTSADSTVETEPSIAVGLPGHLAAVWLARKSSIWRVGTSFSDDRGATWSAPQLLSVPVGSAGNATVTADTMGGFHLAVLGVESADHAGMIYSAAAPATGGGFGPLVAVTESASRSIRDAPSIVAAHDGSLNIVYCEGGPGAAYTTQTFAARSSDGGATWQVTPLTDANNPHAWTAACASRTDGRVGAVFLDYTGLTPSVGVRLSDDDGRTWPAANTGTVTIATRPGEFPSCLLSTVGLFVLQGVSHEMPTGSYAPTLDSIELSYSVDNGRTFKDPIAIEDPAAGPRFMRAIGTAWNERLSVVYYAGAMDEDPAASLRIAQPQLDRAHPVSELVHSPIMLTTSRATTAWLGDLISVATDGANTYVAFTDNAAEKSHIGFRRLQP